MNNEWKHAPVEMCKKLVELGVVLDTEKYWCKKYKTIVGNEAKNSDTKFVGWKLQNSSFAKKRSNRIGFDIFPAPDVAEFGKIIDYYEVSSIFKCKEGWDSCGEVYKEEAEARCVLLLFDLNDKSLKPEDVKL